MRESSTESSTEPNRQPSVRSTNADQRSDSGQRSDPGQHQPDQRTDASQHTDAGQRSDVGAFADPDGFLAGAFIADEVCALAPDYRVLLVLVDGIVPGASDPTSEALLARAEVHARAAAAAGPLEERPHLAAWRAAYRGFGAKPQRTRNSAEALLRRAAADGLPRVNHLTDVYNALSVLHEIPLGGEDARRYVGAPRLVRATGSEEFDTTASGEDVVEHPEVGEVVWGDDAGVTCRRWNWRQGRRTALTDATTTALFICDALAPMTDDALSAVGDELVAALASLGPAVTATRRLVRATG